VFQNFLSPSSCCALECPSFDLAMPRNPNFYDFDALLSPNLDWREVAKHELRGKLSLPERRFVSIFGISSLAASEVYQNYFLHSELCHPQNLLWALYFCRQYPKRLSLLPFKVCNERTYSEVTWSVLQYLEHQFTEVNLI